MDEGNHTPICFANRSYAGYLGNELVIDMRQWLISALKAVLAQKLPLLLASLWEFIPGALLYLHKVIAPHLSDPTGWIALTSIAAAVAVLPFPLVIYFWFKPKLQPLQWGVHQNTKTGVYFCSACFLAKKLNSPLYLSSDGKFWKCSVCQNQRLNPNYKVQQEPQEPNNGPHAWMAY